MFIKFKKEHNQWFLYLGKGTFIHSINEWTQLFNSCNWYTFTPIQISFENDIMCPGFEMEVMLLGLGFRFRMNRNWEGTEIQRRIDKVNDKNPTEDDFVGEANIK